ncbi:uncharacterized protein AB675_5405 [Cyphellophora attinorum]|uniref:Uncharacterized protein n=1 Tax=Cyphellophora attinorum TaxID=1664694 RepID=A0A0N0NNU8_9EURO|nr:uncharacterized protein AB675_5405 [Phialophora attinorum]KPI41968.1 hypothetical protein AB675_5405 [Phialophora attinorum]
MSVIFLHHLTDLLKVKPLRHTSTTMPANFSINIDNQSFTSAELPEEEMVLLVHAIYVAGRSPPVSVSEALRECLEIVRKTHIRERVRISACAVIFRTMEDHHEDTCTHQEEHTQRFFDWHKALLNPANGMVEAIASAEVSLGEIQQMERMVGLFRAAGGSLGQCPAAHGIESLRAQGVRLANAAGRAL